MSSHAQSEPTDLIAQFDDVTPLYPVSWVQHTSQAWIVRADGRDWVHKPDMGVNEVLGEAVGLVLGARLEVPVPPGAVLRQGNNVSWLSQVIANVMHWDHARWPSLANSDAMARLYVLDALIHNEDRHSGNLLLEDLGNGLLGMWSIDTADAGIGTPEDLIGVDAPPNPRNHLRPTPLDDDTCAAALAEAERCATALEASMLEQDAALACAVSACPERSAELHRALVYRCRKAPVIVARYLEFLKQR